MVQPLSKWERLIMCPFIRRQRHTAQRRLALSRGDFVQSFPSLEPEADAVREVFRPFLMNTTDVWFLGCLTGSAAGYVAMRIVLLGADGAVVV